MAAHKLKNTFDPARVALIREMWDRDVVNVALAQVVERCVHYAELDPSTVPAPKSKKGKRYGIEITSPSGKAFETVRVSPQLLATAFSETFRAVRVQMGCNLHNDFQFYLRAMNIVDTDGVRYSLAVNGNRFVLHVNGEPKPIGKPVADKKPEPAVAIPKIVRDAEGNLTPATKRGFRDAWNSMLDDAKEPLAQLSENCMLKTPRYLANVHKVVVLFGKGRDVQQFGLEFVAKDGDPMAPRSLGKLFPLTAKGIADALHALRIRCPMPHNNVAAKPPKPTVKLNSKRPSVDNKLVQQGKKVAAPKAKPKAKPTTKNVDAKHVTTTAPAAPVAAPAGSSI